MIWAFCVIFLFTNLLTLKIAQIIQLGSWITGLMLMRKIWGSMVDMVLKHWRSNQLIQFLMIKEPKRMWNGPKGPKEHVPVWDQEEHGKEGDIWWGGTTRGISTAGALNMW